MGHSDDDNGLVSETAAAQAPAMASRHWTPTRQRQARPLPMPALTVSEHREMVAEARAVRGRLDNSGGVVVAPVLAGRSRAPVSSPARKTNRVADMTAYPYSVALKMLMSFGGNGYIGSAFIVGPRAVITAGHCVYDQGAFASNIAFIPRYSDGAGPYGPFAAVKTTVLRQYTELSGGRKYFYDIGACVVDRDFPAELGIAGYTINHILVPGKLRSIGFPGEPYKDFDFDGSDMWTSLGDYHDEDDGGKGTTTERNWGHYNDMTGGCSGGPIFTDGPVPVVVGLNSHVLLQYANGPREEPPRMYSPYFGESVKLLIKWLKDNGGRPNEPGTQDNPPDAESADERVAVIKAGLQDVTAKLNELIAKL